MKTIITICILAFTITSCSISRSSISKKEQKKWLKQLKEEKLSACDYGNLILAQDKLEQMEKLTK